MCYYLNVHFQGQRVNTGNVDNYSRTLHIRIANYPERLGPSAKHYLTVIVLPLFMS